MWNFEKWLWNDCNILTFDLAVNQETGASGRGCHLDLWMGWIRCTCEAHGKQVGVKQLYNQVPQTVWVNWSQLQLEFSRMGKKCCYSQRNLGSICCSLFRLQLTSHTQPFRNPFENKEERYIFLKKCVRSFVIIVDYVSACICIHIVVSWLYNRSCKTWMWQWCPL